MFMSLSIGIEFLLFYKNIFETLDTLDHITSISSQVQSISWNGKYRNLNLIASLSLVLLDA